MRLFLTLLMFICATGSVSLLGATEPVIYLPLNEGTGEIVHDPKRPGVEGVLKGVGGWTEEVPVNFSSGSAWRNEGRHGAAIVVPGTQVPNLNNLESFTIACWVNVREAHHLSRIVSKADRKMEAFFDLRFEETQNGDSCMVLSLRTGKVNTDGYVEKNFEIYSDSIKLPNSWIFVAAVREGGSGEITFYLGDANAPSLRMIGTGKGPIGAVQSGEADLMIGNIAVNMKRAANADFSGFRVYNVALSEGEIQSVRQQAFKP